MQSSSNGIKDTDEVLLDSEMEKVFASSNPLKDKFDVTTFQDSGVQTIATFKNKTCMQQNPFYCNPFEPKALSFLLVRHKNIRTLDGGEEADYKQTHEEPVQSQNYDEIAEDYPLVSERAGHGDHSDSFTENERHVQFGTTSGGRDDATTGSKIPGYMDLQEHITDHAPERKRRKR